jgi:hypothetical protein
MSKPLHLIFLNYCAWIFIVAVLFACCKSETAKNRSTDAPPEMERLLLAADTLSIEALTAEAQKLDGTWVDSFFYRRFLVVRDRQDGPALSTAMSSYEQICPNDEAAGAFIHFCRGVIHQYAGRFDSAEIKYKLAQDWYEKRGDSTNLLQVLDCRSGNFNMRGKYDDAITLKYRAVDLTKNKEAKMYFLSTIANVYLAKGEASKSIELLEAPIRFFEAIKDTLNLSYSLTIQANALGRLEDFKKCLEQNQKALLLRRQIGNPAAASENLFNIARSLGKLGNWQSTLDTLKVAENMLAQIGNKQAGLHLQFAYGEALHYLNRLEESDGFLLTVLEKSRVRKQYKMVTMSAGLLSSSSKKQGKLSEALNFREMEFAYKDSLYSQEKEKIIQNAAYKYEAREKEAQITALKLEKKLSDQSYSWAAVLLLSIVGAGIWFLRYRHRREKALLEKDIATNRLENEVLRVNDELNRQTLENNAREREIHKSQLEEFTALMLEKNIKIEALQSKTKATSLSDEGGITPDGTMGIDDIDALFQAALATETDWSRFQQHFEKVFPGIVNRLKMEYHELSIAELRLVMLTKMGLKTNEIANFIGISADSVRKLRYRLKKKMGFSEEELLDSVDTKIRL